MGHEKYRDWIHLAIADELGVEDMRRLQAHLGECKSCAGEFDELQRLKTIVGETGAAKPSDEMLWEARRDLQEAIRREPPMHSVLARVTQSAAPSALRPDAGRSFPVSPVTERRGWPEWFFGMRWALSGVAAVAVGFLAGYLAFGRAPQQANPPSPAVLAEDHALGPSTIANVRFVNVNPRSREIELQYELVRPVRLRAGIDDARMKRMLAYTLLNEQNDGVRLQAIGALEATAPLEQNDDIKQALIDALKNDPNAGVRKQSLLHLYKLPFDEDIKDACLHVLANDANPGMRVASINMLAEATLDGNLAGEEVYDVLKSQLKPEDNYLRVRTGAFIQEDNNVQ